MFYQLNYHRMPGWFYPATTKDACRFYIRLPPDRPKTGLRFHIGALPPWPFVSRLASPGAYFGDHHRMIVTPPCKRRPQSVCGDQPRIYKTD